MIYLYRLIASGFYSGKSPWAPGTTGSAAFLALWLLTAPWSLETQILAIALLCALGYWSTNGALKTSKDSDPGWIVIDEWAGLAVALLPANSNLAISYLLSFALFRLFDATKPPPIGAFERLPGAWGVMADDLAAGVVAGALTYGILHYV